MQTGGPDAWAETQKGEERTHFCVALLLEPKMRRSFACSVEERFWYLNALCATYFGFGSRDASAVGDSLTRG